MALSPQQDEGKLVHDYFIRHPRAGVMIDVGAHTGTSFRQYLAYGWRVLAFEPDATKGDQLRRYQTNPKFEWVPAAVGEEAREGVQFYTSPESTGIASLVPFRDSHMPAASVRQTTLAAELAKRSIEAIDYLKIDAEGYDLPVLRGLDLRTRPAPPEVILVEFDELKTRQLGTTYRDIGDLLLSHGYVAFCSQWTPIVRYGTTHAWHSIVPYPCELHHPDAWGNFVAVRDDAHVLTMRELIQMHT